MTRKIFQSIIGVAVAVLLGSVLIVMGVLYSYFEEESMDQLRNEAAYAASGIETMGVEYLDGISKQDDSVRITLVAADGSGTRVIRTLSSCVENPSRYYTTKVSITEAA